jgi:superfamily II DNA helicase RecQ
MFCEIYDRTEALSHQVAEFQSYGLTAVAINEDTTNAREFWMVSSFHVHFLSLTVLKSVHDGTFKILIVQPEQLQSFEGHLPQLAQCLWNRDFIKLVKYVHIDEAHTIYTAGTPLYGLPAFRKAWGSLGELWLVLAHDTPIQALSGTFPGHIICCVIDKLFFTSNYVTINLTSNRPNITYTMHPISGSLGNFQNLQFLIPNTSDRFFDMQLIPKTIVFHDNLQEAANAARFLNNLCPEPMRHQCIAKRYHSLMSAAYLKQTFQDFASRNSTTRILHATSGTSTVSNLFLAQFHQSLWLLGP